MSAVATNGSASEAVGVSAYRQVRADILSGRLAPGQRLRLERLREAYGASIATLREILSRLSSEGLVVAEEQRGFQVSPISVGNLRELAALRLHLEGAALEESFRDGDLEWEGRVVSAHHKLKLVESRMLNENDPPTDAWKQYDREFHHALVSSCRSVALMEVYTAVYEKYLRYILVAFPFRGEGAVEEHGQLLECTLKRDVVGAKRILEKHVNDCVGFAIAKGCIPGS